MFLSIKRYEDSIHNIEKSENLLDKNKENSIDNPIIIDNRPNSIENPIIIDNRKKLEAVPKKEIITKFVQYPYFLHRTQFMNLPVYSDIRNGKSRVLTVIRRVEGDIQALRDDIKREVFPNDTATRSIIGINHTNNQIVIKGDHTYKMKKWLIKKGF
ncbi:1400_t:CDS:2 [Diversispora eburnea]|uniref:Large ribosomal subunit protein mL49 n=1 Tax=Diversispora eburnea TaxID=1213867 RepID=A0A9N8ZG35_9GLOM|nr:1400_t:CDS:2 [Diversispora eburnea]